MSKVRYFGIYNGASYSSWDREFVSGFRSLGDAEQHFIDFQSGEVWRDEHRENADGEYVLWSRNERSLTPATSETDYMDLYAAVATPYGTYTMGQEPIYRLFRGERGGFKCERTY